MIHIVGRKGHGKTTLLVELVEELTRRGLRVGTVKHTSHVHELDTPGKDSHRHRTVGASPAAVVTPELAAVYLPRSAGDDPYADLAPMFSGCDLVLVEGHIDGAGVKVEVWRKAAGGSPLAAGRDDIAAVVTDDPAELRVPTWPRADVAALADRVQQLAAKRLRSSP